MQRYKPYFIPAILALLSLFILAWFAWPLSHLGTFHLRVVEAFVTDEGDYLWPMMQAVERGDYDLGIYSYGLLYYNIGFVLVDLFSWIPGLNQLSIIQIMRLESFGFLLASTWLMAFYVRRFVGTKPAIWVFVLVLLSNLNLLSYSVMLHPDTCQLFFVILAVYALAEFTQKLRVPWLMLAGASAGLAFSAKFGGLALLPGMVILLLVYRNSLSLKWNPKLLSLGTLILGGTIVFLFDPQWISRWVSEPELLEALNHPLYVAQGLGICSIILSWVVLSKAITSRFPGLLQLNQALFLTWVSVVLFLVGFAIGSPQSIPNYRFLEGFAAVTSIHEQGHWFVDDSGLMGWLDLLFSENSLGPILGIFSLAGIVWAVGMTVRAKGRGVLSPVMLPFWWIVSFLIIVVFRVGSKFLHYLIPIVPFLLFYVALAITQLIPQTLGRLGNPIWHRTGNGVLFLLFTVTFLYQMREYKMERHRFYYESGRMEAGYWLEKNIQEPVMILADKYTYIPATPHIRHVSTFGIHPSHFEEFHPDWVLIHQEIYKEFSDSSRVSDYLYGQDVYLERYHLYQQLLNDQHPQFEKVEDFGEVQIYRKRASK
ncbi:glycosyltransferase family 39 protein [bacterium SCSIO 12741]|nr:glycosyltransferase family 39 protein [bacterium SCSIO 12741]